MPNLQFVKKKTTKKTLCAASANVCNVVLMRHSELWEGINVLDDSGNVVGTSRVAARHVRGSDPGAGYPAVCSAL